MRIKSIRVRNYKGFADSGTIELGANWTVIVGRNNSGKTSLLECLAMNEFKNRAHRHIGRDPNLPPPLQSIVEYSVRVATKELQRACLMGGSTLYVPAPPSTPVKWVEQTFMWKEAHDITLTKTGDNGPLFSPYPSHGLFQTHATGRKFIIHIEPSLDRQSWQIGPMVASDADGLPALVQSVVTSNAYVFRPERRVNSRSGVEHHLILRPDASNLPSVLHYLYNTNRFKYDELMATVRQVLPEIEMIDAPPDPAGVRLRVWNSGFSKMRDDLAIGLEECGTGIGQVLAVLFVVLTSTTDQLIVIDEPNSYLHPGASRALMRILREHKRHQFVITSHSPEIISALEPDKLVVVRWSEGQSHAQAFDGSQVAGIRFAFDEVGVRLADVFGYDRVVWLEGPTEAKCFPLLIEAKHGSMPAGLAFVSLSDTGSLEGRTAAAVWRAYGKLTQKSAFVPETVAISLDREGKDERQRADLTAQAGGLLHFLPRRTYENYLLDPRAIAAVVHEFDPQREIKAEDVEEWLRERHRDPKYYHSVKLPPVDGGEAWREIVHAPKLLQDLVGHLTENTQDFGGNKVRYSFALTKWLLEHDRQALSGLIEYVGGLLQQTAVPTQAG